MTKGKGKIQVVAGHVFDEEYKEAVNKLADNQEYTFLIVDQKKNRNLPYLNYLFSVVLKFISDNHPDKPSPIALYRFFEERYAPVHSSEIDGQKFEYRDLKSERASDVNDVVERIVEYALINWGIEVPTQEEMKDPEMVDFYSQAYLNQEVDWSNFISSRKNITKDERRNKEIKCV